jgi:hypothetical protein
MRETANGGLVPHGAGTQTWPAGEELGRERPRG